MKKPEAGEFDLIHRIRRRQGSPPSFLLKAIGDDCAVMDLTSWRRLVVSTDLLVEGVHFPAARLHPTALGRKAFLVNLSDVAAMGARPRACLLSLALPARTVDEVFDPLIEGFLTESATHDTPLIGGDLSTSDRLVISVTIFGDVSAGEPIPRDGARPGDLLLLLGEVGLSVLGLRTLLRDEDVPWKSIRSATELEALMTGDSRLPGIRAHLFPTIHVEAASWLQNRKLAQAMIDVSDGLASDVHHLCEESRLQVILDEAQLLIDETLAGEFRTSALERVLHGGEDYAILFVATPDQFREIEETFPDRWETRPRRIGRFEEGPPEVFLQRDSELVRCIPGGYDHFRGATS